MISYDNFKQKGIKAYICSPLGAETPEGIYKNMQKAYIYMLTARRKFNVNAVAPHALLPILLDDSVPSERNLGLEFGVKLLHSCSIIIVCGTKLSAGMINEIIIAADLNLPIWVFDENLKNQISELIPDKTYLVTKIDNEEFVK